MSNGNKELIQQQFDELAQAFSGLKLCEDTTGQWVIRGTLSFAATFNSVTIADSFSILITLPDDYPNIPPSVQETGGRITADFHQYSDRTLCLGAPVEVFRRFKADPRLIAFVKTIVVEYLYGYAYFEKYGKLPFGELSHGCKGIREYYQETFNTDDVQTALVLLKILADGAYRGHHTCPCGSGKILRKCHGQILLGLLKHQSKERFLRDAESVLFSLENDEIENLNWEVLPNKLRCEIDYMAREIAKEEKCG